MSRSAGIGVCLAALVGVLTTSTVAAAKADHDSPYTYEQTFGSTLRLLKVDLEFEVTEINAEWGFLVFQYVSPESGERKNRASFTFVKDDDHRLVHVSLQIPSMPSYHEQLIIKKLRYKLENEHGEPPAPPEPKEPEKDEDEKDPNAPIVPGQDDDAPKTKHPRRRPARTPRRKGR
ncbi:MAG TPA: hypothetical protein ENK57_23820 [Polyangiaceae bacterium]|nr:hypothetical protein [Polyangiaceae bacterium]